MKSFLKRTGLLCLWVLLLPAISHAEIYSGSCGNNLQWKLDTETGLLEIYNSQPGGYSIMDDYTFTTHSPWYSYKTNIRSVSLSGISNIGNCAFYDCRGLTSITIPEGVTSIGSSAFYGCSGLTSITIPESVTSIGNSAFSDCRGLTSITIPESVTSIGYSAFYNCSGLTSVTIPESVSSIGNSAFYNCSGLTSITIPESVTSIDNSAFLGCSSLTSITIPEGVTSIENSAFCNCSGLTSITIPESVTSIGYRAFFQCSGLTSVSIPESVTSIGGSAFERTPWFNNQPDGLVYAGKVAYKYKGTMPSGTLITIEEGTVEITNGAFSGCSGLTSITIPESVTSIGYDAFYGCSSLASITIPESVTGIGIPEAMVIGGASAFSGCYFPRDKFINKSVLISNNNWGATLCDEETGDGLLITDHIVVKCRSWASSVCIPESVTSIGQSAFSGCSGLTSITIPESVTSIGQSAFSSCSGLTSITIPESVTQIMDYTFSGCSGLTSVTIPESVNSIGSSAFASCNNLTSVTINSNAITSATYSSTKNIGTIFGAQVKEYIIGGSKIGFNAFCKCSSLESITILKSVTSIGNYAFPGCSGLTSVTIPESVTSIDQFAFSGCSGLTSVTLNSNAIASATYSSSQNIGTMFGSQVKNYMFGDEVKRIGEYAFASSKEVVSIVLGRNIERLQNNAFSGCDKLEEVRVKASEPPIAFSTAFPDNAYYAVLYVPEGTEALYKEDNVWGRFSRIRTFKDEPEKCVLSIKSAIGGYLEMICNTQTSYTFRIITEKGWQVSSVSFNGVDVTGKITDDSYTTPLLEGDAELSVVFEMDEDEIDMVNEVGSHSQLRVSASASTIYIHNDGDPVNSYIYTTDGKMVKSVVASYGKTVIPVQPDNVYVVKVDNRTFKVAL